MKLTLFLTLGLSTVVIETQRLLPRRLGSGPLYEFGYSVENPNESTDFGHYETKRQNGVVRGQYHVLLPDGRVQLVIYYADETGYHPTITYMTPEEWAIWKGGSFVSSPRLRSPFSVPSRIAPIVRSLGRTRNGTRVIKPRRLFRKGFSSIITTTTPRPSIPDRRFGIRRRLYVPSSEKIPVYYENQ